MDMTCAKCGGPIERHPGPGRAPAYCGDLCKRLVEYEVRRIDRRLAAYELEQRELKFNGPDWSDDSERQKRLRALRSWIRCDEERLRELLAAGRGKPDSGRDNQGGGLIGAIPKARPPGARSRRPLDGPPR